MFEAEKVTLAYGSRIALENVSFRASPGELVAVVGPNGAGKSSLLKVLTGELAPARGQVRWADRDISAMAAHELAAARAVLPQATRLSFPFTVHEVVRLGLTAGASGVPVEEEAGLPALALEKVDLGGYGGRYFQELSGGEQQRVHLARVLCQVWEPLLGGAPRFLILDEPTASLDLRHQLQILRIARDYVAAGGGVIAILHDLNIAAMAADRIVVMSQGRVAASGTPKATLTGKVLREVFGVSVKVGKVPPPGMPFVLPQTAV